MLKLKTPVRTGKAKGGSSSGKMKQASLMSFFKPMEKKQSPLKDHANGFSSSPLKYKHTVTEKSEIKKNAATVLDVRHGESDDESKVFDDVSDDSTPSSTSPVASAECAKTRHMIPSSPLRVSDREDTEIATPLKKPMLEKADGLTGRQAKRNVSYVESDLEDEDNVMPAREKRKRRVIESDSEDDFKPGDDNDDDDDDDMSDFVVDDEVEEEQSKLESDAEDSISISKKRKTSKPLKVSSVKSEPVENSNALGQKFAAGSSYIATVSARTPKSSTKKLLHTPETKKPFSKENEERYEWLVDIKDANKRSLTDPDYDSRTIFIPPLAWLKFTAFEKQYWEIKSKMWDTVVFFKKGKFYELYENDAIIANTEFDLKLAGGGRANMKLAGVPEMSFDYWAKEFISHGYKVARVDQKESLLAKEIRGKSGVSQVKEEKIIKRELTGILTGGTLTDLGMITDEMPLYCMSIKEITTSDSKTIGVAYVDTSTSQLCLIEFEDDMELTKLDTLVAQLRPKEVICEKNNLSSLATKILKFNNNGIIWNTLSPLTEFWDYETTIKTLENDFGNPEFFQQYINNEVVINAFGGLLYYLQLLKLDKQIMETGNFQNHKIIQRNHMILDGTSLVNLEIFCNNSDGGEKGTLFRFINKCITPMGKRMFKQWVLHPLYKVEDINDRYDTVDFLMNGDVKLRLLLEDSIKGLPDLERLIARTSSKLLRFRDFLKVIQGLETINGLFTKLQELSTSAPGALGKVLTTIPQNFSNLVEEWEGSFDRSEALNDVVVPNAGVDKEFDDSQHEIDDIISELNSTLKEYQRSFKCPEMLYRDSGKEIYLLEVPNRINKMIPKDWNLMGSTSKVKRYWSPEVKVLARNLLEKLELHKQILENVKGNIYNLFNGHYKEWNHAVQVIAAIDCLLSITKTSETMSYPSCRPTYDEKSATSHIKFEKLRNPIYEGTCTFIPNDVELGGDKPTFALLTGANAAGKSTIMRTTCLAVICAQLGIYLPCSLATFSKPVDKIMTRLGANDNIMAGKSTFFIELSETSKILRNGTKNSLIILDELGRGGSSSDGFAIATSVLYHLSCHVQSMGFFATHFASLGDEFSHSKQIQPMRMGIDVDSKSRNVTFLYKLEPGRASGSFGMNVASMCGIEESIIDNAEVVAKSFEQTSVNKQSTQLAELGFALGLQSDFSWLLEEKKYQQLDADILKYDKESGLKNIFELIT